MLIVAIILLLISHSLQQYMFKNPIGVRDKSNAASMRNHFLERQQQIEELRNKEMKVAKTFMLIDIKIKNSAKNLVLSRFCNS